MTTATQSRSVAPSATADRKMGLGSIVKQARGLPSRMILHGVEGVGKTSFAAQVPRPIFLMARGETGLETLIDQKRIPETDHFPEIMDWETLLAALDVLTTQQHDFKTCVIDTFNGAERLCHEYVCKMQYGGEWGEKGFTSYQRGYEVSLADWRHLLTKLDELREAKRMAIICLCHTKVSPFRNPDGEDYDRYQPDMHNKTWGLSHKWADLVLFNNFETVIKKEKGDSKAKGKGVSARLLYTERHAAYDAKNRHGMTGEIECGNSPSEAWNNFQTAIKEGRGE